MPKEVVMFQDYVLYASDVEVRYAYRLVHLSGLAEHARNLHKLSAPKAIPLAEALLGSILLASILEEEERINLRFQAGGEFTVAAETTRLAETRGYIEFAPESSLAEILDDESRIKGHFAVRSLRSQPGVNHLFEGHTVSPFATLEGALNDHLQQSFQMKTKARTHVWVGEDGKLRAYGVIYLELPQLETGVAHRLWEHVEQLPNFKSLIVANDDPDRLVQSLIPDLTRPVRSLNPVWGCACSTESVEAMLLKLAPEELQSMIDDSEPADVRCHYCNFNYLINLDRMRELSLISGPRHFGHKN